MNPPIIGFAPYRLRPGPSLRTTPLSDLDFPLGLPERYASRKIKDLTEEAHVVLHPKSAVYWRWDLGLRARASLLIAEPRAVHGWHMRALRQFHRRFFRILSRDRALIASIPNGLFHNHTYSFLEAPRSVDTTKARLCSLIASQKRDLPGHRLRHRIADRVRSESLAVDLMGRAYAPFERKEEGLAPYRFSVVIENSREPCYISEKLIDAALCRTIPIYWGAPDVAQWFNPAGIIACETEDDIMAVLRSLGEIDLDGLQGVLDENRGRALTLMEGNRLAAEALRREIAAEERR